MKRWKPELGVSDRMFSALAETVEFVKTQRPHDYAEAMRLGAEKVTALFGEEWPAFARAAVRASPAQYAASLADPGPLMAVTAGEAVAKLLGFDVPEDAGRRAAIEAIHASERAPRQVDGLT